MTEATFQSTSTLTKQDALGLSLDPFREALTADFPGHEKEWTENVRAALLQVDRALRQRRATSETSDSPLAEVDDTRPTLARQAEELCGELTVLVKQVGELRNEVQRA